MHLSLLENQPIHGLRSLFVATGIVLFVGLSLDWPHSPSWYLVTVGPFLLIFIAAMGLGQRWHCTVWYALSRVWPAGRAGDALRSLLEYRLIRFPRLWLRPPAALGTPRTTLWLRPPSMLRWPRLYKRWIPLLAGCRPRYGGQQC